jgi:hypothetical protein
MHSFTVVAKVLDWLMDNWGAEVLSVTEIVGDVRYVLCSEDIGAIQRTLPTSTNYYPVSVMFEIEFSNCTTASIFKLKFDA